MTVETVPAQPAQPAVTNAPNMASPAPNAPPTAAEQPVGASEFAAFEAAQAAAAKAVEPVPATVPGEPTSSEPPAGEPPVNTPPPAPADKPKGRAADRINELVRKTREAERTVEATAAELAAARARIAELETGKVTPPAATETPPPPAATQTPKGPSPDDKNADGTDKYPFGVLDSAYTTDLVLFATQQAILTDRAAREQEAVQRAAAEKQESALESWADRMESAAATNPDWAVKVLGEGAAGKWDLNDATYQLAVNSDVGTDVLYHLATHPDEARSIAAITDPVQLARHFGRLESRFLTGAQPAPKPGNGQTVVPQITPPNAPPPPPQVRGSSGQFTVPDSTEDFSAFERKWQGKIG